MPKTRIVTLSMWTDEAYVMEALREGTAAYVPKAADAFELLRAIREVVAGRGYLGSPLTESAIQAYVEKAQSAPADPYDTLADPVRYAVNRGLLPPEQ